jgi:hypothetical protein
MISGECSDSKLTLIMDLKKKLTPTYEKLVIGDINHAE